MAKIRDLDGESPSSFKPTRTGSVANSFYRNYKNNKSVREKSNEIEGLSRSITELRNEIRNMSGSLYGSNRNTPFNRRDTIRSGEKVSYMHTGGVAGGSGPERRLSRDDEYTAVLKKGEVVLPTNQKDFFQKFSASVSDSIVQAQLKVESSKSKVAVANARMSDATLMNTSSKDYFKSFEEITEEVQSRVMSSYAGKLMKPSMIKQVLGHTAYLFNREFTTELPRSNTGNIQEGIYKTLRSLYVATRAASGENVAVGTQLSKILMTAFGIEGKLHKTKSVSFSAAIGRKFRQTLVAPIRKASGYGRFTKKGGGGAPSGAGGGGNIDPKALLAMAAIMSSDGDSDEIYEILKSLGVKTPQKRKERKPYEQKSFLGKNLRGRYEDTKERFEARKEQFYRGLSTTRSVLAEPINIAKDVRALSGTVKDAYTQGRKSLGILNKDVHDIDFIGPIRNRIPRFKDKQDKSSINTGTTSNITKPEQDNVPATTGSTSSGGGTTSRRKGKSRGGSSNLGSIATKANMMSLDIMADISENIQKLVDMATKRNELIENYCKVSAGPGAANASLLPKTLPIPKQLPLSPKQDTYGLSEPWPQVPPAPYKFNAPKQLPDVISEITRIPQTSPSSTSVERHKPTGPGELNVGGLYSELLESNPIQDKLEPLIKQIRASNEEYIDSLRKEKGSMSPGELLGSADLGRGGLVHTARGMNRNFLDTVEKPNPPMIGSGIPGALPTVGEAAQEAATEKFFEMLRQANEELIKDITKGIGEESGFLGSKALEDDEEEKEDKINVGTINTASHAKGVDIETAGSKDIEEVRAKIAALNLELTEELNENTQKQLEFDEEESDRRQEEEKEKKWAKIKGELDEGGKTKLKEDKPKTLSQLIGKMALVGLGGTALGALSGTLFGDGSLGDMLKGGGGALAGGLIGGLLGIVGGIPGMVMGFGIGAFAGGMFATIRPDPIGDIKNAFKFASNIGSLIIDNPKGAIVGGIAGGLLGLLVGGPLLAPLGLFGGAYLGAKVDSWLGEGETEYNSRIDEWRHAIPDLWGDVKGNMSGILVGAAIGGLLGLPFGLLPLGAAAGGFIGGLAMGAIKSTGFDQFLKDRDGEYGSISWLKNNWVGGAIGLALGAFIGLPLMTTPVTIPVAAALMFGGGFIGAHIEALMKNVGSLTLKKLFHGSALEKMAKFFNPIAAPMSTLGAMSGLVLGTVMGKSPKDIVGMIEFGAQATLPLDKLINFIPGVKWLKGMGNSDNITSAIEQIDKELEERQSPLTTAITSGALYRNENSESFSVQNKGKVQRFIDTAQQSNLISGSTVSQLEGSLHGVSGAHLAGRMSAISASLATDPRSDKLGLHTYHYLDEIRDNLEKGLDPDVVLAQLVGKLKKSDDPGAQDLLAQINAEYPNLEETIKRKQEEAEKKFWNQKGTWSGAYSANLPDVSLTTLIEKKYPELKSSKLYARHVQDITRILSGMTRPHALPEEELSKYRSTVVGNIRKYPTFLDTIGLLPDGSMEKLPPVVAANIISTLTNHSVTPVEAMKDAAEVLGFNVEVPKPGEGVGAPTDILNKKITIGDTSDYSIKKKIMELNKSQEYVERPRGLGIGGDVEGAGETPPPESYITIGDMLKAYPELKDRKTTPNEFIMLSKYFPQEHIKDEVARRINQDKYAIEVTAGDKIATDLGSRVEFTKGYSSIPLELPHAAEAISKLYDGTVSQEDVLKRLQNYKSERDAAIREYTGTGVQSGLAQVVAAQVMGGPGGLGTMVSGMVNTLASAGRVLQESGNTDMKNFEDASFSEVVSMAIEAEKEMMPVPEDVSDTSDSMMDQVTGAASNIASSASSAGSSLMDAVSGFFGGGGGGSSALLEKLSGFFGGIDPSAHDSSKFSTLMGDTGSRLGSLVAKGSQAIRRGVIAGHEYLKSMGLDLTDIQGLLGALGSGGSSLLGGLFGGGGVSGAISGVTNAFSGMFGGGGGGGGNYTGYGKRKVDKGGLKSDRTFLAEMIKVANEVGIDPPAMLAAMEFESGVRPDNVNKTSGASGLIQFTDPALTDIAPHYVPAVSHIPQLGWREQLDLSRKYFNYHKRRGYNSIEDVYLSILAPAFMGKKPGTPIFTKGGEFNKAYEQNKGLDFNKDNKITNTEAAQETIKAYNTIAEWPIWGEFGITPRYIQQGGGSANTPVLPAEMTSDFWPAVSDINKVSSKFGMRQLPDDPSPRMHYGIDLTASDGQTKGKPVVAPWPGKVVYSGNMSGGGNTVILEHENGMNTTYMHMDKNMVRLGETLAPKQQIGTIGNTGHSYGPHLHFEAWMGKRKNSEAVDPMSVLGRAPNEVTVEYDPSAAASGGPVEEMHDSLLKPDAIVKMQTEMDNISQMGNLLNTLKLSDTLTESGKRTSDKIVGAIIQTTNIMRSSANVVGNTGSKQTQTDKEAARVFDIEDELINILLRGRTKS